MSDVNLARRTELVVTINGVDVTAHIAPCLKEFSFTDNAKGKADEVTLALKDDDETTGGTARNADGICLADGSRVGRWQDAWFIEKGCKVTAHLTCCDWYAFGNDISLPMGLFTVDEVELSGPPDVVKVKAVTAAKTSALSEEQRTKGWENYTLERIAGEIAQREGYSLMYDAPEISFKRIDQREASDLAFLNGLARNYGVNMKVHDGKMILYGAKAWDAKAPRFVIKKHGSPYSPKSWSFKTASKGTKKKAEVAYHDPATREVVKAEATAPGPPPSGQTLTQNQRIENASQAIALGNGALRAANEGEHTANLEWMGFPGLVAGITLRLEGWGKYDGTYFVESAQHKLARAYTTSAELRKTLDY